MYPVVFSSFSHHIPTNYWLYSSIDFLHVYVCWFCWLNVHVCCVSWWLKHPPPVWMLVLFWGSSQPLPGQCPSPHLSQAPMKADELGAGTPFQFLAVWTQIFWWICFAHGFKGHSTREHIEELSNLVGFWGVATMCKQTQINSQTERGRRKNRVLWNGNIIGM